MTLRLYIALALAALMAIGGWFGGNALYKAGYNARDAIAVSDQLKRSNQAIELAQTNLVAARAVDQALQARTAADLKVSLARASRLDQALRRSEATPFIPSIANGETNATKPLLGQSVLDLFTLCVLNAERARGDAAPASPCAASRTDAQVRAASETRTEVTGGDLARSDLEVARRFNDLQMRHNGLVDWVDTKIIQGK